MSGCMNACGHHHVGHIGILGVDKKGEEWYQISLGGSSENDVTLGDILGPSVPKTEVANTLERILRVYVESARRWRAVPRYLPAIGSGAVSHPGLCAGQS
jgi:sulfite reductase beta subunit-like hemoprotein